jgi:ATP-dependent RNA helicase DeaD
MERLLQPTHIVVATPGRLIDLIQRKQSKETNFLVLDEADEMVRS